MPVLALAFPSETLLCPIYLVRCFPQPYLLSQ
jgi:hypothetical protein